MIESNQQKMEQCASIPWNNFVLPDNFFLLIRTIRTISLLLQATATKTKTSMETVTVTKTKTKTVMKMETATAAVAAVRV